jgi:hypothetical protein
MNNQDNKQRTANIGLLLADLQILIFCSAISSSLGSNYIVHFPAQQQTLPLYITL